MAECCLHVLGLSLHPVQPLQKPQSQRDRKKHRERERKRDQIHSMSVRRNYCWKIKQSFSQLKRITSVLHMIPSLKLSLSLFLSVSLFCSVLFFSYQSHSPPANQ